jgi:anaerobic magnesium-protoporphyrin IX monomethyl ester cyclase
VSEVSSLTSNKGTHVRQRIPPICLPDADEAVRAHATRPTDAVDILLVNPPAPDGGIWIRSQHRVGRRSREGMVWPQVSLAQLAALFPDYQVEVIDAIATRMSWQEFESILRLKRPRYYVTQLTGPTLQNDMYGVFLAKSVGAVTITFGTHVTPLPRGTMEPYPALDYALRGEPELTLRELVDTLDLAAGKRLNVDSLSPWRRLKPDFAARLRRLYTAGDPDWRAAWMNGTVEPALASIRGLVWRRNNLCEDDTREGDVHHPDGIVINADRPFISNLDDLPLPRHELLPLDRYRAPMVRGAYAFVVTSRGCPAGCRFCIKHVSNGGAVRYRSPENVLAEIEQLLALNVRDIHMYADLFTINREHVLGICEGILQRGWKLRWTCNSRVDFVDAELLQIMARAGCWMISWGIESGDEGMLKRMHKGITPAQVGQALRWSKQAHIMNWGYFIIGLPGETEESIRKTIAYAKRLPIDLVLFHIAAPHPGTPFFFEVVEQGWFRPGTRWEEVDMDRSTVLDYPNLRAEQLEHWARVAFRQWAMRPGPALTYLKVFLGSPSLWRAALEIGLEALGWARG